MAEPGEPPLANWRGTPSRSASLRFQLLAGLAVLLIVALTAAATVILLWLPIGMSPWALAVALLILIGADVAVLLMFGDYLLKRLVVIPVAKMVGDAERIAGGEERVRLEADVPTELQRLSGSVNDMADRLLRNQHLLADNVRSLDETNRALMEARSELIRAEKLVSVGRLAAGIGHEIGNPLGAIMGYLEVAKRRGADDEWIEGVQEESKRIDRIVRGLLDYARPRAASVKPVQVNEVVRQSIALLETQGRLKRIDVRTVLAEDVPDVLADRFQLEQVLVNLLLNATDSIAEAGSEGTINLRTLRDTYTPRPLLLPRRKDDPEGVDYSHLRRMREPPASFQPSPLVRGSVIARIEVQDNGTGLRDEDAYRIFDPFYTTKAPGRGTGLGLAVSARLIDGMGGMIEAAGRPDAGAVFTVSLPASSQEAQAQAKESEE